MKRDLRPLFAPSSVAVLGASEETGKWGHRLALGALRGEARRPVYLVNRRGATVLGRTTYRSLAELPGPVDLVAIAVPAAGLEQAVSDALEAGARALIVISSGLAEAGEDGRAREQQVAERVRAAGAVLLGPNCLGVFDATTDLDLGWDPFPSGWVALLSQSGNLTLDVGLSLARIGLGFSRVTTLGNQADLDVASLLEDIAGHEQTQAVAVYVEDMLDGRAFAGALARVVDAGKRVLVLAAGSSDAGRRAARSHTGALASDAAVVRAVCADAGARTVTTLRELVELLQASLVRRPLAGRRIAIVGDGGGHGVLAADAASRAGLLVPRLTSEAELLLGEAVPGIASAANPVDLGGASDDWLGALSTATELALGADGIDAALLTGYFGGYGAMDAAYAGPEMAAAAALAATASAAGRPLVVHSMYEHGAAGAVLRSGGVPVYRDVEAATGALAYLADVSADKGTRAPVPPLPTSSPQPLTEEGYPEARRVLAQAGLAIVAGELVRSVDDALAAARTLGYPVVLKALGSLHKSDAGGVVVGLACPDELRPAFVEISERLAPGAFSVERMAPTETGVELIVGCRNDPRFGPVVLVGLGGIDAELLNDVALALGPIERERAEQLLLRLRGSPRLTGSRGRPPLALARAADAAARLSQLVARHPEIAEIEVNPLLVTVDDAVALDARLILQTGADRAIMRA